jgi:hypothetical protein
MTRKLGALLALAFAAAVSLAAGPAQAKDEACTDGQNCLCDRVKKPGDALYTSNVVFCEDFEDPVLNNGNDVVPGVEDRADGWADKYGPGVSDCLDLSQPAGEGLRDEGMEGTNPWSCINIVQENACEVGTDCVFQGKSSLAHRFRPNRNGGIVGNANWGSGNLRNFGATLVMKFSTNYISPKDGNAGPANKTNEWGPRDQCILGCSVSNAGNPSAPFAATLKPFLNGNPGGVMVQGQVEWDGSSGFRYGPTRTDYDFTRDWGKGNWGCMQMQWTGWGTSNAEARYWFNGKQIVHLRNLNMTGLQDNAGGISSFAFNNYYNGPGTGTGYPGTTLAHRLEDNIVVTSGAPVSCNTIGLGVTPPPQEEELGAPGQPVIINP